MATAKKHTRSSSTQHRPSKPFKLQLPMFTLPVPVLFLLAAVFIGVGDRFLPKPLSNWSIQARTSLNNMMVGAFPQWRPKTQPHQRTEDALKQETETVGQ